jgi:hypothetical protein
MTGVVEAASLALAVLPVVISVAENFSTATRALKRYRSFSSEVGRLSKLVKIQRTIFHNEIRLHLASCVGWDQAEQLLQDIGHAEWNDKCLEESFASRLGSARESFLELVDLINAELSGMEARLKGFEEVAQLANTVSALLHNDVVKPTRVRYLIIYRVICGMTSIGGTKSEKNLASPSLSHGFKNH